MKTKSVQPIKQSFVLLKNTHIYAYILITLSFILEIKIENNNFIIFLQNKLYCKSQNDFSKHFKHQIIKILCHYNSMLFYYLKFIKRNNH